MNIPFQAPYGGVMQHVTDPGKHHGFRWIVAYAVAAGSPGRHAEELCRQAQQEKAPQDAVYRRAEGTWARATGLPPERFQRLRRYVDALEKHEAAVVARRQNASPLLPPVDPGFPLSQVAVAVGMWEVTEDNWGEFYVRIKLLEAKQGRPFLRDRSTGAGQPITPQMARDHVGLQVMSSVESREAWLLRVFGSQARELEHEVERFDPEYAFAECAEDAPLP